MDNSAFLHMPPDVLRFLLTQYLPRWAQLICRMTCVAFRRVIPPYRGEAAEDHSIVNMLIYGHGQLPLVEWACSQGGHTDFVTSSHCAVESGASVPLLEWLASSGFEFGARECYSAAQHGQLATLKWLYSRNGDFIIGSAHSGAYIGGHLPVVQWLVSIGDDSWINQHTLINLGTCGHFSVLRWLREHYKTHFTAETDKFFVIANAAAGGGHLDIMKWALEEDSDNMGKDSMPVYGHVLLRAAFLRGHLNVIEYLHTERHVSLCEDEIDRAPNYVLQWQMVAARNGYLRIAKWLHARNYPWDDDCCYHAASSGHYELLKWIRQNGAPWGSHPLLVESILDSGNQAFIKWARADGCPGL